MKDLKRLFFNPPQGGNERGVPTQDSMGSYVPTASILGSDQASVGRMAEASVPFPGPAAATRPLSDDFAAGVYTGRTGKPTSGGMELRNYHATREAQQPSDPGPVNVYDFERRAEADPEAPGPATKVVPTLDPPGMSYRTDGKPLQVKG